MMLLLSPTNIVATFLLFFFTRITSVNWDLYERESSSIFFSIIVEQINKIDSWLQKSIKIDNHKDASDWFLSISDSNRLIGVCYDRLRWISIEYRKYRLDTPCKHWSLKKSSLVGWSHRLVCFLANVNPLSLGNLFKSLSFGKSGISPTSFGRSFGATAFGGVCIPAN